MSDIVLLIANRNIVPEFSGVEMFYTSLLLLSSTANEKKVVDFLSSLHPASYVVHKLRRQSRASYCTDADSLSYLTSGKNTLLMHCTQGVGGSARLLSCWFSYGGLQVRKQREGTTDVRLCISKWFIAGWQSTVPLGIKTLHGNRSSFVINPFTWAVKVLNVT